MTDPMERHWTDDLVRLSACPKAVEWARGYDSLAEAWAACERGDWVLWLARRVSGDVLDSPARRRLALAGCACGRLALPIWEAWAPTDHRPEDCLALRERWGHGEDIPDDDLYAAMRGAAEAAWVAEVAGAARAAWAAEAAWMAEVAEAAEAAGVPRRQCADAIRTVYPEPPEVQTSYDVLQRLIVGGLVT